MTKKDDFRAVARIIKKRKLDAFTASRSRHINANASPPN